MGLPTLAYWPVNYWAEDYWADDYWPEAPPTPYPLYISIAQTKEYGITITGGCC